MMTRKFAIAFVKAKNVNPMIQTGYSHIYNQNRPQDPVRFPCGTCSRKASLKMDFLLSLSVPFSLII